MAVARITAMALALVAAAVTAQQVQFLHLSIKVMDTSGAVIPGARIQIGRSSVDTKTAATTDHNGEAAFDLSLGSHVFTITAHGFAPLIKKIDVKDGPGQTIVAELEIGGGSSAFVQPGPEIPLEYQPVAAEIPLIPTEQFTPPAKPLRHRRHWF